MRRMPVFQAGYVRPLCRLCQPSRHLAAVTADASAVAAAGAMTVSVISAVQLSEARSHGTGHTPRHDDEDLTSRSGDSKSLSLTRSGGADSSTASLHDQKAPQTLPLSSSLSPPPPPATLHTLASVEAFVRQHSSLCHRLSSFSSTSSQLAPFPFPSAARATIFHHTSTPNVAEDGSSVELAFRDDGTRRHSRHASRASAATVEEIRRMLDKLTQDAYVLDGVSAKVRHRLVTDVCRVGYAVGLHRRCCAVYADLMLRRGGASDLLGEAAPEEMEEEKRDGKASSDSSTPDTAANSQAGQTAPLSLIPEFVVDAAGEAADLATLQLCFAYAVRRLHTSRHAEMGPGFLAALHVYVQCVRVAVRHGWHASGSSSSEMRDTKGALESPAEPSREVENRTANTSAADRRHAGNGALEPLLENEKARSTPAEQRLLGLSASPLPPATSEQQWWQFTLEVLRALHIDEPAAFYHACLRGARYRYVDAGGFWPAAQAAVYAPCFRCWVGEDAPLASPKVKTRRGTTSAVEPAALEALAEIAAERTEDRDGEGAPSNKSPFPSEASRPPSPQMPTQRFRLTAPALTLLLRTAVVARQYDIAEWATLYTDVFLEEALSTADASSTSAASSVPKASEESLFSSFAFTQVDQLLVWHVRFLLQTGQHTRACRWLRRLRQQQAPQHLLSYPGGSPVVRALQSLPVVLVAARLAGEARDADLAVWCLQLCLGGDIPSAIAAPTHADIFSCLCAYARCGLPTFAAVVASLQSNGLLQPTAEELLFVRLLHTRRSAHWRDELAQCLSPYITEDDTAMAQQTTTVTLRAFALGGPDDRSSAAGSTADEIHDAVSTCSGHVDAGHFSSRCVTAAAVFSTRVMHHVLLILQEGEHPRFMAYYRTFLLTFSPSIAIHDRARMAELALTWAAQQQGTTALDDLVYLAREVDQLIERQRVSVAVDQKEASDGPAMAPELYRRLERGWSRLYERYPPEWWRATASPASSTGHSTPALSAHEKRADAESKRSRASPACAASLLSPSAAGAPSLLEPDMVQRLAHRAETIALAAATPSLMRFVKRRQCLPVAVVPATELFASSVRTSCTAAAGEIPTVTAHVEQLDRERWLVLVAAMGRMPK